jgi:hypothetical protein
MPAAELETAGEAPAPVQTLARQPNAAELAHLAGAVRAGRMSAADTRRLQRMIGNRAVTRILAREDNKDARPMQDAKHKADAPMKSPSGHEMVWDAFARRGRAVRSTTISLNLPVCSGGNRFDSLDTPANRRFFSRLSP